MDEALKLFAGMLLVTLIIVGIPVILSGCAGPEIIRVKNCKSLGAGLYDCEVVAPRDWERFR